MNKEDIIRMAREAGMGVTDESLVPVWHISIKHLERFAALVASAERERCAQVCEDHFMSDGHWCAQAIRKGEK